MPTRTIALLGVALLITSCGIRVQDTVGALFKQPVAIDTSPPALADINRAPQVFRYPDIVLPDGQVRRVIYVPPGAGEALEVGLKDVPEFTAANPILSKKVVIRDPNGETAEFKDWAKDAGLESCLLTGSLEEVDSCEELIAHFLTAIPNVLIEARVVEVVETDEFGLGFDWFTLNAEDYEYDPTDPLAGLRRTDTVFNRGLSGRGIPALPGIIRGGGFIPNLLVQLGTIQDDLQVDLLLSALSQLTQIDVVNAPNVAVRSGHIAAITAGEEVPYFTVQVSGNNQTVSTKFKEVAVNLTVLPTVLSRGRISLAVKLRVQNITGISQVETGGASTTNPIIASRSVTTTMDVNDGATVVLGGLITTRAIDVNEKVPLLGDIPIVDFLFSNQHSQDSHSNLLFIIRPKIIAPGTDEARDTITPPEDGEIIAPPGSSFIEPIPDESGGKK